jgi:hypothetical protein
MIQNRLRFPLLALSAFLLLAAIWAGLLRMGWPWPVLQPTLPLSHGPLMVSGFLGTLISLERAVALRRGWTYLAPALSGVGGLLLVLGIQGTAGPILITLGSLFLVFIFVEITRQHPAEYTAVMALGAFAWLVGNVLWLTGWPIYHIVFWWAGFLVLTIAGERLELGRLVRLTSQARRLFLAACGLILAGLILVLPAYDAGTRLVGLGMLALAVWLLRYDISRRTVRKAGLPRYAAVCLLSGYAWLAAAGLMALIFGGVFGGLRYDAMLHAIFLGFVFSMIFGHAPIIIPAVLGVQIVFHPILYLQVVLLHLSLLLRVGGDLTTTLPARSWGGLLNGIALLAFLGGTAYTVVKSRRGRVIIS